MCCDIKDERKTTTDECGERSIRIQSKALIVLVRWE